MSAHTFENGARVYVAGYGYGRYAGHCAVGRGGHFVDLDDGRELGEVPSDAIREVNA